MTDPNRSLLVVVADRSGSMTANRAEAEAGLNHLLDSHRAQGTTDLYLAEFDDQYDVLHDGPLAGFGTYHLRPRGMTALLDAVGRTFTAVGAKLAALAEDARPGTVFAIIATDGLENASQEWSRDRVHELVTQQQDVYSWQVIFLGAGLEAFRQGAQLGVDPGLALDYAGANSVGTYAVAAASQASYRQARASGVSGEAARKAAAFTDDDRARVR